MILGRRRWTCLFQMFLLVLFLGSPSEAWAVTGSVERFTPNGKVRSVHQVSARFSEAMVTMGDPRQPQPFTIQCPAKGVGRWLDDKTWVYDFGKDVPGGTACDFILTPDLQTLAGHPLTGTRAFRFSTGGPSIVSEVPSHDQTIDEDQAFILRLNAEPDLADVAAHAVMVIAGVTESLPMHLLTGAQRSEIIKQNSWFVSDTPAEQILVVQPTRPLPAGSKVKLVWGKEIKTKNSGLANEQDQTLNFTVRPPLTLETHCTRVHAKADCMPIESIEANFSSPISQADAKKIYLTAPDGGRWNAEGGTVSGGVLVVEGATSSKKARKDAQVLDNDDGITTIKFKGPFPAKTVLTLQVPEGVHDDAGRTLANAASLPLSIKTDNYPPLAKFASNFGIIEANAEPALAVTLRSLEPELQARLKDFHEFTGQTARLEQNPRAILQWLTKIDNAASDYGQRDSSVFATKGAPADVANFKLPREHGPDAFEVIGVPFNAPGLYVVEVQSLKLGEALLGKQTPMYVASMALVTNLAVHFKWGRESSLVWVTALDSGKPVGDAELKLADCTGKTLWEGRSKADGTAAVNGIPSQSQAASCENLGIYSGGLLVMASAGNDTSFVHTSWNRGIESWRFQLPMEYSDYPDLAHTVLDRTLVRAGETVHMKHVLRRHTTSGFAAIPIERWPDKLVIRHDASDQNYELPLQCDASGSCASTWSVPKEAKLGTYSITLSSAKKGRESLSYDGGSFRVEEFRVPLMKAVIKSPDKPVVAATATAVDVGITYLSGGGAGKLPIVFRSQIQAPSTVRFADFDGFEFANGGVKEGLQGRGEASPNEAEGEGESEAGAPPAASSEVATQIVTRKLSLDGAGTLHIPITGLTTNEQPYDVLAEMQFNDPDGEVETSSRTFKVYPAQNLVAIQSDGWATAKDSVKFKVAVADLVGKPVAGARVHVMLYQRHIYSHRKRLVGGFYAYESSSETKRVGELCDGETDDHGLMNCEGSSPVTGEVMAVATTHDSEGHASVAYGGTWVSGGDQEWWFDNQDNDRMDLIPEAKHYEPGDTAKLQVRMPFREATALVAVEREGVVETFVEHLSGKDPIIEVPIKANYAPNVFVSVLAVRGRLGEPQPTALVDLGKPAFKLGITQLKVGWSGHELKVKVTSDKPVYYVRDKAVIDVAVTTVDGKAAAGGEIALAAVDEGLLELAPNHSWDLLSAMMGLRNYAVDNATAQMQVVGKRHFGLKALAAGGGGGMASTRELFDTLLYWQDKVPLDSEGKAKVSLTLNDSLTSFRIVAVAQAGLDHFGMGEASIKATQDLMLFSGLPPVARVGDKLRAHFTARNTTEHEMKVTLNGTVKGLPSPLTPQTFNLAAGEAKDVSWDIDVPPVKTLDYLLTARAEGGREDRLKATQTIREAVPVRTLEAQVTQLEAALDIPVARPAGAVAGRGGMSVGLTASLLTGLAGVREYMSDYPFACMEQQVSKAVVARDASGWRRVTATMPAYLDSEGMLKYFPNSEWGSDVLTAYVLAIAQASGWDIPGAAKNRMLIALDQFVAGKLTSPAANNKFHLDRRKLAALEALSRYQGITAAQLSPVAIKPDDWSSSALLDWLAILLRQKDLEGRDAYLDRVTEILRARINLQGSVMNFSAEATDGWAWLMASVDENAVKAVLLLADQAAWKTDIPRLVRGAFGRQRHGHWDLTTANAWGVLAVEKFAQVFETLPVSGTTTVQLAAQTQQVSWPRKSQDTVLLPWPEAPAHLTLTHQGSGKPWANIRALAALPLKEPLYAGFRVEKTVTPVDQKIKGEWHRGDTARIHLALHADADMPWVVVEDPIPAGASVLGSGLGGDSAMATEGEHNDGPWLSFQQRSFDAYRAYYEMVNKGEWITEYTVRLNNDGHFLLPATHVEAMYAPEMFADAPNQPWDVRE